MRTVDNAGLTAMDAWLRSAQTVRICGLDFRPIAHPVLTDTVQCIVKGQAAVYFLRQQPQGNTWLLKKFSPSRRPADAYLEAVHHCLPGGIEFFTCTQRRLIGAKHIDFRFSQYRAPAVLAWLEGTILMPKVPGSPWSTVADSLREGESNMTLHRRLHAALNLAACIDRLESGACCHRDLSCSNVFLGTDGRVYLIDWDSLFHASLRFQVNTTIGTPGYIAPFTRAASGEWDGARSWCPCADRYALAILLAEILLTGTIIQPAQEDGTMFGQAHLEDPDGAFVQQAVDALWHVDRDLGLLFWRALHASFFERCPSPAQWRATLSKSMQDHRGRSHSCQQRRNERGRTCTSCGATTRIATRRCTRPGNYGDHLLCAACARARRRDRDRTRPVVTCEHCRKLTRIPREKLNTLRTKGSPVLCPSCLRFQLNEWKREQSAWDHEHPEVVCPDCGIPFRIPSEKRNALKAQGKRALCRICLETGNPRRNGHPPHRHDHRHSLWVGSLR